MADDGFVRINLNFNPGYLVEDFQKLTRAAVDDVLVDVAAELEAKSYEGATGQLKQGWDIIPSSRRRSQAEVQGAIVNRASRSINRIVGRPAGRRPPTGPIKAWVLVKITGDEKKAKRIAFLIARKIGASGTKRWKSQENFAGLNRDGSFKPGGLMDRASKEIARRLDGIKLAR